MNDFLFFIIFEIVLYLIIKIYNNLKQKNQTNNEKENKLKIYIENNNELLLLEDEFKQAYKIIKNKILKNKYPVNLPIAITLGGQPGAGKSNIYEISRKRFSNNIVELDLDIFRIFHPYYKQIKKIYGNDDVLKTNPFVFKVVDLLIEELSIEKYNLIIESSLNTPNSALYNGNHLPSKGYKVEIQIMATPKEISWQGTIDRYNKELNRRGYTRAVSREFHDKVVSNICNSLKIVKNSRLMSNIIIYNRNKNCLYDMKKDKDVDPCFLLYLKINELDFALSLKFHLFFSSFYYNLINFIALILHLSLKKYAFINCKRFGYHEIENKKIKTHETYYDIIDIKLNKAIFNTNFNNLKNYSLIMITNNAIYEIHSKKCFSSK